MYTLKPRPHQQQCQSNIVECYNDFFRQIRTLRFGNNVERVFREISCYRQSRNKLNTIIMSKRSSVRLYQSNIRLCRKNRSTCRPSIRQCCFDILAGVDGLVFVIIVGGDTLPSFVCLLVCLHYNSKSKLCYAMLCLQ